MQGREQERARSEDSGRDAGKGRVGQARRGGAMCRSVTQGARGREREAWRRCEGSQVEEGRREGQTHASSRRQTHPSCPLCIFKGQPPPLLLLEVGRVKMARGVVVMVRTVMVMVDLMDSRNGGIREVLMVIVAAEVGSINTYLWR